MIGVTSAENAARVLAAEGLDDAHNIAHFLGYVEGSDERRGHLPIGEGDWLVVDEAGTVDTADPGRAERGGQEPRRRICCTPATRSSSAASARAAPCA